MKALATPDDRRPAPARWGRPDLRSTFCGPSPPASSSSPPRSASPPPVPDVTAVTDGTITGPKIGVPYAAEAAFS